MPIRPLHWILPALLIAALSSCHAPQDATPLPPPQVSVVTLAPHPYHSVVDLPGRTVAYLVAPVVPQVTGIIQARLFEEGATVSAGDTLYRVDPAPYKSAVASACAALAKARAAVLSARPLAERDAELTKIDAISREDLESAQATLRQDEAAVQAAEAELDVAQINLGYTEIKAPISGTVGTSVLTPGSLVSANQASALTTIYAYDPIYVDITQSSDDVLRLRRQLASGALRTDETGSARIRLTLGDGTAYPQEGRLQFSGITVNEDTGTITLRATVPNPDKLLMPGMYVRASLEQGVAQHAILIPQQAVSRDAGGNATVLLVDNSNRVRKRVVTLWGTDDGNWVVEGGVTSGDRVIVEGSQNVSEGSAVTPHAFVAPPQPALASK